MSFLAAQVSGTIFDQNACSKNFARASATVLTRWGFGSYCQLVLQL
jgi:hypothetical protein